jgi:hypothetical protein
MFGGERSESKDRRDSAPRQNISPFLSQALRTLSRRDKMKVARLLMPGIVRKAVRPVGHGMMKLKSIHRLDVASYGSGNVRTPKGCLHRANQSYRSLRDGSVVFSFPGIKSLATFISSLRDKNRYFSGSGQHPRKRPQYQGTRRRTGVQRTPRSFPQPAGPADFSN